MKKLSPRMRLRSHLVGLVLVTILPVMAFSAVVLALLNRQQTKAVEESLRGTTKALAAAVDERLASVVAGLSIMADLEEFERSSLREFHRRALRVVKSQEGWHSIALVEPDGTRVLATTHAFGTALSNLKDEPFVKEVLRTGRPAVSGYRVGTSSRTEIISVGVPVKRDGKIAYMVVASLELQALSKLLLSQSIPSNWTAAILDRDGILIARSRAAEHYVGGRATRVLAERSLKETEGVFEDMTQEGRPAFGAFSRSRLAGWTIVLGLPSEAFFSSVWQNIGAVVLGGFALLGLAVTLAFMAGRGISRPITVLTQMAGALGRGEPIRPVNSSVSEVAEVAEALELAALKRDRADERAQAAIQLRDNFLSVASHELKTPLTSLQLQLQLLQKTVQKRGAVDEALARPAERMYAQIKRLVRLIDELLDVSRIAAGRMDMHPERVELRAFLEEIALQFHGEQEKSGSELRLVGDGKVEGCWDRSRLDQVFTNLLSNAFKYGAGKPVELSLKDSGDWVEAAVSDDGIGIAPEDQERIFERFERAVPVRNYGGLGLGLWISKRIVENLGGEIRVKSAPERGATFTVRLPKELKEGPRA